MGMQVGSRSDDEPGMDCKSHLWRWSKEKNHWYCATTLCFETREKLSGNDKGNIDLRDKDTCDALNSAQ